MYQPVGSEDTMKNISMKSLLIVARLDEMEILSLHKGQTLADIARAIDEMETE